MGPESALSTAQRYNKHAMLCPLCKNDHWHNSQFRTEEHSQYFHSTL